MRLVDTPCDIKQMSPLSLAFVGDAVYEVMVRETLLCQANRPAKQLHQLSVRYVKAESQASAYKIVAQHLTEEETAIFKRGRNAHPGHIPKNAESSDYHIATGFETLVGYLYLTDQTPRLKELFNMIINHTNQSDISI